MVPRLLLAVFTVAALVAGAMLGAGFAAALPAAEPAEALAAPPEALAAGDADEAAPAEEGAADPLGLAAAEAAALDGEVEAPAGADELGATETLAVTEPPLLSTAAVPPQAARAPAIRSTGASRTFAIFMVRTSTLRISLLITPAPGYSCAAVDEGDAVTEMFRPSQPSCRGGRATVLNVKS